MSRSRLTELATVFLKLGTIGLFGFLGVNTLIVLLMAGFGVMAWQNWRGWRGGLSAIWLLKIEPSLVAILPAVTSHPSWLDVLTIFLKIGATIYGGGYVLLAFLQPELVDRTHWLTSNTVRLNEYLLQS